MTAKPRTNLVLDTVIFGLFVVIMITGLLVWVVYPSGGPQPGGWHGDGPAYARTSTLLGVDKHTMTDLHSWLGLVMAGLVTVHLAVHWKWITCQVRRFFGVQPRRTCRQPSTDTPPSIVIRQ